MRRMDMNPLLKMSNGSPIKHVYSRTDILIPNLCGKSNIGAAPLADSPISLWLFAWIFYCNFLGHGGFSIELTNSYTLCRGVNSNQDVMLPGEGKATSPQF